MTVTGTSQLDALEGGRAFADLSGWRVLVVRGSAAREWLHDLITADVEGLGPGRSARSLVLTPTGRVRADFHVAAADDGFVLLQSPEQPEPLVAILAPYVLSSDVELDDRTGALALFAVLDDAAVEDGDHASLSAPSVLGTGVNVLVPATAAGPLRERLTGRGLVEVSPDTLDTWRIRRGEPRMMADFGPDALPAEAGLESAIDFTKGCFLGQESVAKVRNLGHPPRILLAVRSPHGTREGDEVMAKGSSVGEVTSAAAADGAVDAIVRIRWEAAAEPLSTELGLLLLR